MSSNIEYYPLTHPQKGIWYTEKLYPGTSIGNIAATLKISDIIDFDLMEKAINLVIEKNDAFRMRIVVIDGEPRQHVTPYEYRKIDFIDFSGQNIEKMYEWDEQQAKTPFNLVNTDLCYFAILKITESLSGFFIKIHHTMADAWAVILFGNEAVDFYHKLKNGQNIDVQDYPSYLEYIKNEEHYKNTERYIKDKQFWNEKFSDTPELTSLKSRKKISNNTNSKRKTFIIPNKLCTRIHSYCSENKISVLTLFSSALSIYAGRVLDKNDIILGTPVLNRVNHIEKETIGMFISMVPIRLKVDIDSDFTTYVEYVQKEWMSILKHQRYSADLILKDLRDKPRGFDKLYDITLSYQNSKFVKGGESFKQEGRWHFNGHQTESLNIHINERENDGNLILDYDYLPGLFFSKEIEFVHDHIIRILWHALDNPGKSISRLEMVSEKEKSKILKEFNNTDAGFPKDKGIDELFEEQVLKTPDNTAVVFKEKSITYRQLNEKANKLARHLREMGVGTETIVGIMASKSIETIIGILGIIKAGGCYLPIDPDYPAKRINYMLEDSKTGILLINEPVSDDIIFAGQYVNLADEAVFKASGTNLPGVNKPDGLLYIIYTSGSTGNPKGTMISHRNVVRLLFNDKFSFDFSESDSWTLFHSLCFDFSVWEMYGALLYGGKLVVISKEDSRETRAFLKILTDMGITVLNQTPSAFNNLIMEESQFDGRDLKLRYVIFGGEALKPNILQTFRERYPFVRLINMYGITETTVHVTFKEIGENEIIKNSCNIGRPIPTTKVYILDRNLNLLPIGIPGELCVSGDGVGRGYLNRKDLTQTKFIRNPYNSNEILYRSGDLGRFYADGEIEYLGRIDNQVKIRGFRIELGEIESALLKHEHIRDIVVSTKANNQGDSQLVAFYVSDENIDYIQKFLAKSLPEHMIPSYFIRIPEIPLTMNGKTDLNRLFKLMENNVIQTRSTSPITETQKKLAAIWSEVLGTQNIGIDDDFFYLGGDSLSAIKVNIKIGNNVTFSDLYNNSTIRKLSELLEETACTSDSLLTKLTRNNTETEYSIISIPYGGGSPGSLLVLSDSLSRISTNYTLYAANIPRDDSLDMKNIVKELVAEIKSKVKNKIIIYGHCVGSAMAIKIAAALEMEKISVKAICLGGILPPRINKFFGKSFDPWRFVSNGFIVRFLNKLGLTELSSDDGEMDSIINDYRYDVRNFYKCFYELSSSNTRTEIPIHCIVGESDPMTRNYKVKYKNWLRYSKDVKLYVIKKANHYFLKTNSCELADILVSIT